MNTFIIVASFSPETDLGPMNTVRTEEIAQVEALRAEGRLGFVHISIPRGTVFLEAFAADAAEAQTTIETLPMAKWWTLDLFPTSVPPAPPE